MKDHKTFNEAIEKYESQTEEGSPFFPITCPETACDDENSIKEAYDIITYEWDSELHFEALSTVGSSL